MNVGLLHWDSLIAVPDVLLAVNPSAARKARYTSNGKSVKSECQTAETGLKRDERKNLWISLLEPTCSLLC